jgi:predicted dehydrogenase
MKQLRMGVIGTGVAAELLHWPALEGMKDRYAIVAVTNRTREKAQAFADLIGLDHSQIAEDYRALIEREDVDVVLLALPPQLNLEVATQAARAGKHIICEKPIAVNLVEAREMLDIPQAFGVKLLIAENFRYDAAVRKARELIDAGEIKAPYMISYQYVQPVPADDIIAERPWRQKPEHAGGFISDHGVHMINVIRFLMGEIRCIHALGSDRREHLSGPDSAVINLTFESGTIGSVQWSFAVASDASNRIELYSDDGTLELSGGGLCLKRLGQPDRQIALDGVSSFTSEFEDFHSALVTGSTPLITPRDAFQDLEAAEAVYRSICSGKVVELTVETKDEA